MPPGEELGSPLGNCPKSQAQIYVRDGLFCELKISSLKNIRQERALCDLGNTAVQIF
jgi:hypothetical protein